MTKFDTWFIVSIKPLNKGGWFIRVKLPQIGQKYTWSYNYKVDTFCLLNTVNLLKNALIDEYCVKHGLDYHKFKMEQK